MVDPTLVKLFKKVTRTDFEWLQVLQIDPLDEDFVIVGIKDAEGNILKQETVRKSTDSEASLSPGAIVHVGYDREGYRAVIGNSFTGIKAQGGSPSIEDKDTPTSVINEQYIPLNCHPTTPPSLFVVVRQFIYINRAGERRELPTSLVNLTPAVGGLSAGEQCLAALFLVDDGLSETPTVSVVTSTPKSLADVLGDDDESELLSAEPADTETPIYAWLLQASLPEITDAHRFRDLRQLINIRSDSDTTVTAGTGIDVTETGEEYEVAIADEGVDTTQLADDAVTTDKLEDNAVTLDKLAGGSPNLIFKTDGSGDPELAALSHISLSDIGTLTHDQLETVLAAMDIILDAITAGDFTEANHDHEDAPGGGQLGLGALATEAGDANKVLARTAAGVVASKSLTSELGIAITHSDSAITVATDFFPIDVENSDITIPDNRQIAVGSLEFGGTGNLYFEGTGRLVLA